MERPKVNLSHNYNMNSKIIKDLTTKIHVRSRQNIATLNWKWWKRKLDNNSCMYKKIFDILILARIRINTYKKIFDILILAKIF